VRHCLEKTLYKKRIDGVAQDVGLEFKPQYHTHKKRHCLINWIKKEDMIICCLQETNLIDRNKHWLRSKAGRRFIKLMVPENRQE
jgi:hypothetical protein